MNMVSPRRQKTHSQTISAPSYKDCPAKTFLSNDGSVMPGRSVLNHSQIVGMVAQALVENYPKKIRLALFPAGSEFIAALQTCVTKCTRLN